MLRITSIARFILRLFCTRKSVSWNELIIWDQDSSNWNLELFRPSWQTTKGSNHQRRKPPKVPNTCRKIWKIWTLHVSKIPVSLQTFLAPGAARTFEGQGGFGLVASSARESQELGTFAELLGSKEWTSFCLFFFGGELFFLVVKIRLLGFSRFIVYCRCLFVCFFFFKRP